VPMAEDGGIVQVAHAVHDFEKVAVSAVKELAQPNADDAAVAFEGTVHADDAAVVFEGTVHADDVAVVFAGTVRLVQVLVGYAYFDAAVVDAEAVVAAVAAADVEFAVALDTKHVQAG
jgi:hypothetical protein